MAIGPGRKPSKGILDSSRESFMKLMIAATVLSVVSASLAVAQQQPPDQAGPAVAQQRPANQAGRPWRSSNRQTRSLERMKAPSA